MSYSKNRLNAKEIRKLVADLLKRGYTQLDIVKILNQLTDVQ